MRRLDLDTLVAVVLLLAGGVLFWDTYQWRRTPYATMASSAWPRFILVIFLALCALYFLRSLRQDSAEASATKGILEWARYYRNVLWCYGLFLLLLATMPYFGMLVGGTLFVWATQIAVGERTLRAQLRHAMISIVSVGLMWAVFTYALGVILPEGSLFRL